MKKKVLLVITKSNWGGAQRYVFDLATHLPREEFEVVVAYGGTGEAGAQGGALSANLQEAGIRGVFLQNFMRDMSLTKEWGALKELLVLYTKEKPDVVHLNSSKAGGIGALAARIAGIKKIVFTAHGWPFQEQRPLPVRVLIWLASWLTALLCTDVICVSDHDLAAAKRMPCIARKAVRIYNGIAPMQLQDGHEIRDKFPPGAKITGTIGELTRNKNQIALIEEARHKPDLYVAIVGFGEDWTKLDEKIKEYKLEHRVHLFGFMQAERALKGFDIFALPSLKEGLPYVLLEAKQAGLPIVANPVGGIPEILHNDMQTFTLARMVAETKQRYLR